MRNQKEANKAGNQPADPYAVTLGQCDLWSNALSSSEELRSRCFLYVMTEREFEIHDGLRRIKQEVSEIKRRLKQYAALSIDDPTSIERDRRQLAGRLDQLRREWKRLDEQRIEAARERMRLLGHDPD